MRELTPSECLPTLTQEERQFLHYNPNTKDIVDWANGHALAAIENWARARTGPRHPTLQECERAGRGPENYPGKAYEAGGLPDTQEERERFEAYMRGHCWEFGAYSVIERAYDTVHVRQLYGVWRDRGSLPTPTVWERKK